VDSNTPWLVVVEDLFGLTAQVVAIHVFVLRPARLRRESVSTYLRQAFETFVRRPFGVPLAVVSLVLLLPAVIWVDWIAIMTILGY